LGWLHSRPHVSFGNYFDPTTWLSLVARHHRSPGPPRLRRRDDAQRAKAHVVGIEIIAERERVPAVQPAQLGLAALIRGAFTIVGSFVVGLFNVVVFMAQLSACAQSRPNALFFGGLCLSVIPRSEWNSGTCANFVTVAERAEHQPRLGTTGIFPTCGEPAVARSGRGTRRRMFRREKSGLKLTPAGEAFLAHARDLLRRSGDAMKQMESFGKRAKETLTVGYLAPVLVEHSDSGSAPFCEPHPDIEVALREMSPADQLKALPKTH